MTELCWQMLLILLHLTLLLISHGGLCDKNQHHGHRRHTTKRKSHDFFSGSSHLETLSWAVKLTFDPELYTQQELDMVADLVALETGLDNVGQIGEFKGHYYFVHKFHRDTTKHITTSYHSKHKNNQNDTTGNPDLDNTTEGTVEQELSQEELKRFTENKLSAENLTDAEWWRVKEEIHHQLDTHQYVQWHMQQLVRSRQKRSLGSRRGHRAAGRSRAKKEDIIIPDFNDEAFPKQWHLLNLENIGFDINVTGVWQLGLTGKGVTTAVIDDGLEWTNPDLRANYSPEGSWDLNSNDADPMPHGEKEKNHHGTRCAGEIAAVANNYKCGVGVAYGAKVAGIRVLDGPMTDSLEATAFMKGYTVNDVYSCSWGPDDDGKTVDGPHYLATRAMRLGVDYGRQGYGAIYVVASGNGGQQGDNCNYDGYANSIYTLTIGAVDEYGSMPFYAEECASMLAVTYSSGHSLYQRSIVTTDWMKDGGTGCTEGHTGTSAAAPLAAGIIALMLEARPCLTWRDVQYLVVMTAKKVDVDLAHWYTNAAGLHHSHKHGFGLMNAWALVNAAMAWEPIPWMTVFTSEELELNSAIPTRSQKASFNYSVTKEKLDGYQLFSLEYVQVIVTIKHTRRGDLEIRLNCPSNTQSVLGASRPHDDSRDGFMEWTFSTVRCWGEEPQGTWTLLVTDIGHVPNTRGQLVKWRLKLFGSPMTSDQVKERRRTVKEAADGHYLQQNITAACPPPPLRNKMVKGLSERILKVLTLCSAFCVVMGIYQSFEYAFCYEDEKKDQYKLINLIKRARRMAEEESLAVGEDSETSRLLAAEGIPLRSLAGSSRREDSAESARLLGTEASPMQSLSCVGRDILSAQSADVTSLDNNTVNQDQLQSISTNQDRGGGMSVNSNIRNQTGNKPGCTRPKVTKLGASQRNGARKYGSPSSPTLAGHHSREDSSSSGTENVELVSGLERGQHHWKPGREHLLAADTGVRSKSSYYKLNGSSR